MDFIGKDFLFRDDLSTYDPYDLWKTPLGLAVKSVFYKNRLLGLAPAGALSLVDFFANNSFRIGYRKQEYPMVRALAAAALLSLYQTSGDPEELEMAKRHLDVMVSLSSKGYSGFCCGMNAPWMSKNGRYPDNMPYSTNTPYALEALVNYRRLSGSSEFDGIIRSVFDFVEKDLLPQRQDERILALTYAPINEPRVVINANSYSMYMYALLLEFVPERKEYIAEKIARIFNFISDCQQPDGSWQYYADDEPGNFIDCFHSCFVLKNILKTGRIFTLPGADRAVSTGYSYILNNFYDDSRCLFKRFSKTDKPGLVKFDLYDNAEMLHLAVLLSDATVAGRTRDAIEKNFVAGSDIYSVIDLFGFRRNRNMLRWAVMPYLSALSEYLHHA